MKKTFTHQPVIPKGWTGKNYNQWMASIHKQVDKLTGTRTVDRMYQFTQTTGFILLVLIGFCLQACKGNGPVTIQHDTGTYYQYRAINLRTGRIELAKVDTVWDVYQSIDTVYLDSQGFIAQNKAKIQDTVQLGICVGTVTLIDDTIILSATHFIDKGDHVEVRLDVPPPPLGTAD